MNAFETFRDACYNLVEPWIIVLWSISYIPVTIRQLIRSKDYSSLFSLNAIHDALFGTFWASFGPGVKEQAQIRVIPLFQGRVRQGRISDDVVSPSIRGTVLEVGAGCGLWADVFSRFAGPNATERLPNGEAITKIYGIEPNAISAKALQARVRDVGLGDIYQVAPVGIESIDDPEAWDGKIEPGSVDSIVTILCLCSIPEPEKNIKLLYRLLKPGGTWFIYEHVKTTRGGPLMSFYQRLVSPFWKIPFQSCNLCRDTTKYLRDAGPWEEFDVAQPDEPSYSICPHILGIATKQTYAN